MGIEKHKYDANSCIAGSIALIKSGLLIAKQYLDGVCSDVDTKNELLNFWFDTITSAQNYTGANDDLLPIPIIDEESQTIFAVTGIVVDDMKVPVISDLSRDAIDYGNLVLSTAPVESPFYKDVVQSVETFYEFMDHYDEEYDNSVLNMLYLNTFLCSSLYYLMILYHQTCESFNFQNDSEVTTMKLLLASAYSVIVNKLTMNQVFTIDDIDYRPRIVYIMDTEVDDVIFILPKLVYVGLEEIKN